MGTEIHSTKRYTFLPFQLCKLLDGNCYKILSILINLRRMRSVDEIEIPLSKLSEFSGMSESNVRNTLLALEKNSFIRSTFTPREYDPEAQTYKCLPNKYSINDSLLMTVEGMKWDQINQNAQIKSSHFSKQYEERIYEKKPLKTQLIYGQLDINLTAEQNVKMLAEKGINVSRATVGNVLKDMRDSVNYVKPIRGSNRNDKAINHLSKKIAELEQIIKSNSQNKENARNQESNIMVQDVSLEKDSQICTEPLAEIAPSQKINNEKKEQTPNKFEKGLGGCYLFGDKSKWSLTNEELEQEFEFRCKNNIRASDEWSKFVGKKLGIKLNNE